MRAVDFPKRVSVSSSTGLAPLVAAAMASKPAKRPLSPAPLPQPKRQLGVYSPSARTVITSFDNALYDELVLFIFSFLDSRDLCAMHAASKNCSRLACDNQVLACTLPLRRTLNLTATQPGSASLSALEDALRQRLWQSPPSGREWVLHPKRWSLGKGTPVPRIPSR